ncbi:response regulator [Desulfotalea psychrophila]|uniref:protein-glutamate methylesterase n=1 Tax=Desulfotalea psychrophila (strain LSv54 / DSM 12343) TaxID=177439 RepID=Q6AK11_DESPS|nr:response regulator [Desulfotalea psychrophila]CAG37315.1 related to two-component system response regulator (Che family) [Desulfotalea psychrophila LSv54]
MPTESNLDKISVLLVDDSPIFRKQIKAFLETSPVIDKVVEAGNGLEALGQVLSSPPDVVLMDLEMPYMDGLTALGHLLSHHPLPVIALSELAEESGYRFFDALKVGAVDFMAKGALLSLPDPGESRQVLLGKILAASGMTIAPRRGFEPQSYLHSLGKASDVVFCEDCGHRQVLVDDLLEGGAIVCSQCDDLILFGKDERHIFNNFATVLVGDGSSFANLLDIIPNLSQKMPGSIICVIDAPIVSVDSFTHYLASMSPLPVQRAVDGISVAGGNCYVAASAERICLRSSGTSLKLEQLAELAPGIGPMDVMIASVSKVFRKKSAVVVLSALGGDSLRGVGQLVKNGGSAVVLREASCLYADTAQAVGSKFTLAEKTVEEIVQLVYSFHLSSKLTRMA